MFSALIITFREALEASLIIGIVLAYLTKASGTKQKKSVWQGVAVGVVASVIVAFIFQTYFGGFEGREEQLYEGTTMIVASVLIVWLVVWMMRRRDVKKRIEGKVELSLSKNYRFGLFMLSFLAVVREGTEAVIFLQGIKVNLGVHGFDMLIGAILGIILAILASYLLFKGAIKFPLKYFFNITSVILILFAIKLLFNGSLELAEADIIPFVQIKGLIFIFFHM